MNIKYKGYEISQSDYNNHIIISKNQKIVMHISATEKFSIEQLKLIVDFWLEN